MADEAEAEEDKIPPPPQDVLDAVFENFLILAPESIVEPLAALTIGKQPWRDSFVAAEAGLRSVISAATLPFRLTSHSVHERRFDRFHIAQRIRGLKEVPPGSDLTDEHEEAAWTKANKQMSDYASSTLGSDSLRNATIGEMFQHVQSEEVKSAAREQLVQTLISTWTVFESFSRSFVIHWINEDPSRANPVVSSPDLREFFGKQTVDFQTIGEHGFNLSQSMGFVLFQGKRLDNLKAIKGVMKALFSDENIQRNLSGDLWLLNQRRNLFVHNRGVIDEQYLAQTGEDLSLGDRLTLTSEDVEKHLRSVQVAILNIAKAATTSRPLAGSTK